MDNQTKSGFLFCFKRREKIGVRRGNVSVTQYHLVGSFLVFSEDQSMVEFLTNLLLK